MATYPARTRERTVRVGREAPYQGGEAATQAPVKRPIAGSIPAPGAPAKRVPIGQLAQAAAPSWRKPGFESLWGHPARVDQQPGRRPFTAETAGQHRPRVMRPRPVEDSSSSKRADAGSNPAGRTTHTGPRGPIGTDAALRTRRQEVRILP